MAASEKHGLAKQFTRLIVLSGLASFLLLVFLQIVLNKSLRFYFDQPEVQTKVSQQQVNELHPDPAHPAHSYQENIFFTGEGKDYYHFMLMRGKAHEVHPAERELGWAFVSRFRRLADGTLADSRDSEGRGC